MRWGVRLADVLSETPDGNVVLDLRRFHDVVPASPVPGFPYGARPSSRRDGAGPRPTGERRRDAAPVHVGSQGAREPRVTDDP